MAFRFRFLACAAIISSALAFAPSVTLAQMPMPSLPAGGPPFPQRPSFPQMPPPSELRPPLPTKETSPTQETAPSQTPASVAEMQRLLGPSELPACHGGIVTPPESSGQNALTPDDYPLLSKVLNEEGKVIVRLTVDQDGGVSDVSLATSSGNPRLDDAAIAVVKARWHYKPALSDGKATACRNLVEVVWKLDQPTVNVPTNGPVTIIMADPSAYPDSSRERREQGVSLVMVLVSESGASLFAVVVQSSGYPLLDEASVSLAKQWHVAPPQIDGKPIRTMFVVGIAWTLPDAAPQGTPPVKQ